MATLDALMKEADDRLVSTLPPPRPRMSPRSCWLPRSRLAVTFAQETLSRHPRPSTPTPAGRGGEGDRHAQAPGARRGPFYGAGAHRAARAGYAEGVGRAQGVCGGEGAPQRHAVAADPKPGAVQDRGLYRGVGREVREGRRGGQRGGAQGDVRPRRVQAAAADSQVHRRRRLGPGHPLARRPRLAPPYLLVAAVSCRRRAAGRSRAAPALKGAAPSPAPAPPAGRTCSRSWASRARRRSTRSPWATSPRARRSWTSGRRTSASSTRR